MERHLRSGRLFLDAVFRVSFRKVARKNIKQLLSLQKEKNIKYSNAIGRKVAENV